LLAVRPARPQSNAQIAEHLIGLCREVVLADHSAVESSAVWPAMKMMRLACTSATWEKPGGVSSSGGLMRCMAPDCHRS
jgi:hypothetical protein